jgi:hypothetical protein
MPTGQLARGLIRSALTGYFTGYTYACIINGTPMITRLSNDECPHAWYVRNGVGGRGVIVPVSTSSLRGVIIDSMRALSGGGEVDLLGEAGLA